MAKSKASTGPWWDGRAGGTGLLTVSAAGDLPSDTEVLGVPVLAGPDGPAVPKDTGVELDVAWLRGRGFEGKAGDVQAVPADDGSVVVAVGVGEARSIDRERWRKAGAAVVRAAGKAQRIAIALPAGLLGPKGKGATVAAQALTEGAALASYKFTAFKSEAAAANRPERSLVLVGPEAMVGDLAAGVERGSTVARATAFARDLINTPAGALTPVDLAGIARRAGEAAGLRVTVLDELQIDQEGLGGLAGVARGSDEPARLIKLEYLPAGGKAPATVAVVGKGITFDSGGLSLKTADGMTTMKTDMSGAAATLAAMCAVAELSGPNRVVGFMPTTENMPGGRAIKPGDVLKARNGKTIEVLNTDAEGRLVLADGLSLAVEEKPDAIIDIATLTGAVSIALGRQIAAIMGNDDRLIEQVRAAGERSGERLWPLPLPADYRKHIDSEVADIKNIGNPGQAGSIIAGLFLQEFVDGVPWAHLDIAGTARADGDDGYVTKGGTGYGVRTLVELLMDYKPAKTGR